MPNITNDLGLSHVFVIALQRALAEYRNAGWRSATGLIDSPRVKLLCERHDGEITIDVSDALAMIDGIALHDMLANLSSYEPEVTSEKAIIIKVLGQDVKMQCDRLEPVTPGETGPGAKWRLRDFKRTKVGAYQAGGRSTWTAQGNIYRTGFSAMLELDVVDVVFDLVLSNWNKVETVKHDYPEKPIMPLDIEVWSHEQTKAYLEERVALYLEQEKLDDDDLQECTPQEMWSRPDMFGVWKKKGTTKPYRQYKDKAEALEQVLKMSKPELYEVRFRAGERVRCQNFCDAAPFCNQKKRQDTEDGIFE